MIRVFDEAGNVIVTHEHAGDLKEWVSFYSHHVALSDKREEPFDELERARSNRAPRCCRWCDVLNGLFGGAESRL